MSLPGISQPDAATLVDRLQDRLTALTDLHLTLKHVHWNVVGPNFIGVHEMLDPQVDAVREMSDKLAERIAALGGEPMGLLGPLATGRRWDDYPLNRATTSAHLAALDLVYDGVITDHRRFIAEMEHLDLVSQDMLIDQTKQLELFQWFVRAHLEDAGGRIRHGAMRSDDGSAVRRDERVGQQ